MKSVARLYKNFQPENYKLHLVILDPAVLQFNGNVVIRGRKTGRPAQRITLHQNGLTIDSATITRRDKKGEREIPVSRINRQNSLQEVRLHTDELLYPGEYEISVTFHGTITRAMTGLYPSYFNLDGQEHILLATQFESHFARYVFPSIDEPEAKATFDLTVTAPTDLTVLSNTPVVRQEHMDDQTDDHISTTFATTPKMSTYLLALVIGELQSKSTVTKHGTEISVWATIAQPLDALDYALDISKRSIEFFDDYFGVHYPLPKSDQVALPDMGSSIAAMENWGLITYRESSLLAYPGSVSQATLEHMNENMAHEISHQWFGNLVTMRWWDDLWLNESFANMMAYQAIDAMHPEWKAWDEFVMREGLAALRRDATVGVQSVQATVRHPVEINTIFDPYIVYAKGGRLLYMLKNYLGEEAFRKGLATYFTKHAYGNTSGNDLWAALGEASNQDAGAFMTPWLERSGFPVLTVDVDGDTVTISQKHFLENGEESDGRIWPVPLFSNHPELPKLLSEQSITAKLQPGEPLVLNQEARGHYIVHYANAEHRAAIIEQVSNKKLPATDRLMLLNYASMLAKAGYQPFSDTLQLLEAYRNEQSEPVWGTIALIIGESRRFIDLDESLEPRIKAFIRELIREEYKRLGWHELPSETPSDRKLRATIIGLGAYADESAIIKRSLALFDAYKDDPTAVPPELLPIVFSVAAKRHHPGAFSYLLKLHDETANADLREDVMAGLTAVRLADEASVLLDRLTQPSLVKPQDATFWLVSLMRNRYTRAQAWDWMTGHWDWIEETYKQEKSFDDFPRYASGSCNTKEWADKYAAFFTPKIDDPTLQRNITIGLNEIATRVAWLERDLKSVQQFFKA